MKIFSLVLVVLFCVVTFCFAAEECGLTNTLIDDFEGTISGGAEGTVDFGAGNGSTVEVTADTEVKQSGAQSLKVNYAAVSGGYIWIARGSGLDAANAGWLVNPADINWQGYQAITFYLYANNSGGFIAFDIKDNGGEMWRYLVENNFTGWKKITCNFSDFYARDDWQPADADKNAELDFPIASYQLEPLPAQQGVIYVDKVTLE